MNLNNLNTSEIIKSNDKSVINKSKLTRIQNQFISKNKMEFSEELTDDVIFHVVSYHI